MRHLIVAFFIFIFVTKNFCQVDLRTGAPQLTIPLYDMSDDNNRLATSAALSYTAGNGLNVDDAGSSVGTGWDLTAGGYISRQQNGEPDDQKQPNSFPEVYSPGGSTDHDQHELDFANYVKYYYPNGYLYSEYPINDFISNRAAFTLMNHGLVLGPQRYLTDKQQDIFTFNINGRTGQFCIGKDRSVLFLNQKDKFLKVSLLFNENAYLSGLRTTLQAFTITDENGIQYLFQDQELAEVIENTTLRWYKVDTGLPMPEFGVQHQNYHENQGANFTANCDASNDLTPMNQILTEGTRTGSYVCDKWMLTKILNPLTQKEINFTYVTEDVVTATSHSVMKNVASIGIDKCSLSATINSISARLKKISTIVDQYGDKIEFIYNDSRKDLTDDKVLNKINYYEKGNLASSYGFAYKYFLKNTLSDFSTAFSASDLPYIRLCLVQIQKTGADNVLSEHPVTFDYYTYSNLLYDPNIVSDIVPPRYTFYKDPWNYYNGAVNYKNALTILPGNCYPRTTYNHADEIRGQISGLFARNGLIKSVTYSTGGTLTYNYEPRYVLYNNTNTQVGGVRVNSTVQTNGISSNQIQTDYKYTLSDNTKSSGWGYNPPVYGYSMPIFQSGCTGHDVAGVNLSVRLSSVFGPSASIGSVAEDLGISFLVSLTFNILMSFFDNNSGDMNYTVTYQASEPINYKNKLPLEYSQVTVSPSSGSTNNGAMVYYFTNPAEFPLDFPNDVPLYSTKPRYSDWKYGLLEKTEIYDNSQVPKLLRSTQNFYNIDNSAPNGSDDNYLSVFWKPVKLHLACNTIEWGYTTSLNNEDYITHESYHPLRGKMILYKTENHIYDKSGNDLPNTTTYTYNTIQSANDGFLALQTTTNSKGQKIETSYKYVSDYSGNAAIDVMKQKNNLAALISKEDYIYRSATNANDKNITSGTIIEYALPPGSSPLSNGQYYLAGGDIRINQIYQLRSPNNTLLNNSALQPFNPALVVRDPAYYIPVEGFSYNGSGSITDIHNEKGNLHYLYDDVVADRLVAEVSSKSATPYLSAFTSFENASTGGWTYSGSAVRDASCPTGNLCYDLGQSNGSLSYPVSGTGQSLIYIVSYWSKNPGNSSYSVTGSTHVVKGNTSNGWTYYEHTVSNVSSVIISGSGYIDEVRLYPQNSVMQSYTYDPLFGKRNGVCDANNKVIHYEYDKLARQSAVLDQNRNIIRTYCYNYFGQSAPCQIGYQNVALAGIFIPNNCPGQQSGNPFLYRVDPGKYVSYASQDDADNQALQDIGMNGQSYANNQPVGCTANTITLINSTSYSTNNTATIDGTQYYFPAAGGSAVLPAALANGVHTIRLSSGPSSCYTINGVTYNASQTIPDLHYATSGNLVIKYITSCSNSYAPPYKNVTIVNPVRNDCGTGQTGSQVVYTVPAGTYTSNLSQDDADSKAAADAQTWAHNNGSCTTNRLNKVYLKNTSTSSDPNIYVLIDGYRFNFPASGGNIPAVFLPSGKHTFSFSCGPEFNYLMVPGTSFYCAATQPAIEWTVNADLTLICGTTVTTPDPYKTMGGNITSASAVPSNFCCRGCIYTGTLYMARASSLVAGTQLYTDQGLTHPVSGITWFFPYNEGDGNTIYQITSEGKVGSQTQSCP